MSKKNITIKDIAKKVGVSPRSVSLALNKEGRLSAGTRELILKTAEEMHYRPNILAKGLVKQRTFLIGVVVPYLTTSFFPRILSGIEERCLEKHYDILLGNSSHPERSEKGIIQRMIDRQVDGIICCPDPKYYEFYEAIMSIGKPLVQIMTHVKGIHALSVLVDDVRGGELATSHLIELGHRKIGFLSFGDTYYEEINLRREGYRKALLKKGIALDPDYFEESCDLSRKGGYEATNRLIRRNPDMTAVFCSTDTAALGAVECCINAGKKVPEDISIVGYDDLDLAAEQIRYPLTTVAQPKEGVGTIAFEMLYRLIEKQPVQSVQLSPHLICRATSGPAAL